MPPEEIPYHGFGGPPAEPGTVYLVGAGPGDLGLLTLRAAQLLSTCDVVAYDRLAPQDALELVPEHAEQVCVGKRSGEPGVSRAEVDQLLRNRAEAGRAVVRFKGGDPFVFGRGGEEAIACRSAGIPVEVVHGVTSAVAAPGAAGIPLTHRTVSAGFTVVTGHEDPAKSAPQVDLGEVAGFSGTLVVMMGVRRLPALVEELRRAGRPGDTPIALVEWGTTPRQRTVAGTLDSIVERVSAAGLGKPTVIVVGDVVTLRDQVGGRPEREPVDHPAPTPEAASGPGSLTGVGVGPGDPDLLTIRGREALRAADVLFVPVAEVDDIGYAERVVAAHGPHQGRVRRLVFSLDPDARAAAWQHAADEVVAELDAGHHVAFATIGDPNVYSTFTHLAREVRRQRPDVAVHTVPGITAMQELAARTDTVLLERDEQLTLLPFTAGRDRLEAALADADTVVLYKGGRRLPEVRGVIENAGRAGSAVFGTRVGLDGEDVADELPDGTAPYLSTVIVTRAREDA